jgi:hypothetical protein
VSPGCRGRGDRFAFAGRISKGKTIAPQAADGESVGGNRRTLLLQERKSTSNGVGHVGKEYALLPVSLMDYGLNAATVLPQTKTVDAVASAQDKHVGISPDGVLLVAQDSMIVCIGNAADAIYAPLPDGAADRAQRGHVGAHCIRGGPSA